MSARDLRLVIAPRAQRDIDGLLTFSERHWGRDQRLRYQARIERALHELLTFPVLGPPREDLAPGLRVRQVGEHVIYYRHGDDAITVLRILHRRMDPERHLP